MEIQPELKKISVIFPIPGHAQIFTVLTRLHDFPLELQDTVRQALLKDTYVDNGGLELTP